MTCKKKGGRGGKIALLGCLCVWLIGCSGIGVLNSSATTEQQLEIMKAQNARGCVFFSGSGAPWASVRTILVGTWGADPPSYAECFKNLPASIP